MWNTASLGGEKGPKKGFTLKSFKNCTGPLGWEKKADHRRKVAATRGKKSCKKKERLPKKNRMSREFSGNLAGKTSQMV